MILFNHLYRLGLQKHIAPIKADMIMTSLERGDFKVKKKKKLRAIRQLSHQRHFCLCVCVLVAVFDLNHLSGAQCCFFLRLVKMEELEGPGGLSI